MPDDPISPPAAPAAPAAPVAAPAPVRERISAPRRGGQPLVPAPPGPVAGHPIGPVVRGLPPGIPQGIGPLINTQGTPAVPAPEAVARHPSFAPVPAAQQAVRTQAAALRAQLITAVTQGHQTRASIDASLAAFKDVDPALLAAEGIDLDRIAQFRDAIDKALALTV